MSTPIVWTYDNGALHPATPFMARLAGQQFSDGERYRLVIDEERSRVSHAHEFAWLKDAWASLPERYASMYPTEDHLRKAALIEAGFYNQQVYGCASNAEAHRTAKIVREREEHSVCVVDGNNCIVRTAKSQKMRGIGAMNKAEFQASKQAIMEVIADMIGTDAGSLNQARAA